MKKLDNFQIFGTQVGSQEASRLDEISILATSETLKEIGVFLINAAYEMERSDTEHMHLQDAIQNFSYKRHVDIISINRKKIKFKKS